MKHVENVKRKAPGVSATTRARAWCFTLNNWKETDSEYLCSLPSLDSVKYLVFGRECGELGTPHLQGYVRFVNAKSFSSVRALLPDGCHLEKSRGSPDQNRSYCIKEGDFEEFGEKPLNNLEKGIKEKERWDLVKRQAKEGKLDEIPSDIFVRYYSTLKRIAKDYMPEISDASDVTGLWYYGVAGVGKSRAARDDFPGSYLKMANKWWDGYQDQEFVIIDDLDPKHVMLGHHLKIWGDRYAFLAEIKGGARRIRPVRIVVTSQYSIREFCGGDMALEAALARRYSEVAF